jgi:hypothetical protein
LPVIYLVPEMNGRAFRRRCERFGIKGQLFRCMTISDGVPCDLSDPVLKAAAHELKPVIILDTAIRLSTGDDENSASDVSQNLARFHSRLTPAASSTARATTLTFGNNSGRRA